MVTVLPFTSLAVIVRLSAAPAAGVEDAAPIVNFVVAPMITVADFLALVSVQERHLAVTV